MSQRDEIRDELKELGSSLAKGSVVMPFEIPAGYFESFPADVLIIVAEEPGLSLDIKQIPFEVPEQYFAQLPDAVITSVLWGSKPEIPAGYFEGLPGKILAAAKASDRPATQVTMPSIAWKNLRWAAAALLVIGLGVGAYVKFQPGKTYDLNTQLAKVSTEELNDYVQTHIEDFDTEQLASAVGDENIFSGLGHDEMIEYLNENGWTDATAIN